MSPLLPELKELLARYGQEHLLDGWEGLTEPRKESLLHDIECADWSLVGDLYGKLVVEKEELALDTTGFIPSEPIKERRQKAGEKGAEILRWGASGGRTKFAGIVVAGGTGSGLKYDHPKGIFPATPLSGEPLYLALIRKFQAAARVYGHERMYPLVFMISEQTEKETIDYIRGLPEWEKILDRVIFTRQKVLPVLIREPGKEQDGKAFLKSPGRLQQGGDGHGDAFDYILNPDEGVEGLVWSGQIESLIKAKVVTWLASFGVEYVQYMNVDNLLNPLADKYLVGEHVLSRDPDIEKEGRAHIALGMVKKTQWDKKKKTYHDRLGNVIILNERKESIDYVDASDKINACEFGDPSLRLVTLSSLAGSIPIHYSVEEKTDRDLSGSEVPIYKFERSSSNKKRYGIELAYGSCDVFAAIKKRDEDAKVETPSTAKKLQSDHWKKLAREVFPELEIPDSTVLELPWEADYISPEQLKEELSSIDLPSAIRKNRGILVTRDFQTVEVKEKDRGQPPSKGVSYLQNTPPDK